MVDYLESILIKRCKDHDTDAFTQLMTMYKVHLFLYLVRKCGNRERAEYLLQETLIKIWKNIPKYQEKEKFSSWIFSIAHNVSVDYHRKNSVRKIVSNFENLDDMLYEENISLDYERKERLKLLNDALSNLSELQKEVFLLRQHGEMTFREIAKLTNQPLNTVLSHMNYAVKKLKKLLRTENAER